MLNYGEFYLEGDADEPENFGKGLDALEGIKDRLYSDRGLDRKLGYRLVAREE